MLDKVALTRGKGRELLDELAVPVKYVLSSSCIDLPFYALQIRRSSVPSFLHARSRIDSWQAPNNTITRNRLGKKVCSQRVIRSLTANVDCRYSTSPSK